MNLAPERPRMPPATVDLLWTRRKSLHSQFGSATWRGCSAALPLQNKEHTTQKMSDQKPPGGPREGGEHDTSGNYPAPPEQVYPHHFYPHRPPPQMAAYTSYHQRQQFPPYPYHPYHMRNVGMDPASSPPHRNQEGFHPPLHQEYPGRNNAAAVTPESTHMIPAEFTSPHSSTRRRPFAPVGSVSPPKRPRTGTFHRFVIRCHSCMGRPSRRYPSPLSHWSARHFLVYGWWYIHVATYVSKFGLRTLSKWLGTFLNGWASRADVHTSTKMIIYMGVNSQSDKNVFWRQSVMAPAWHRDYLFGVLFILVLSFNCRPRCGVYGSTCHQASSSAWS